MTVARKLAAALALSGALAAAVALGSGSVALAAEACPNEAIRAEQGSTYLPDCRAYELVSVGTKGQDATVDPHLQRSPFLVAGDGETIAWSTYFSSYQESAAGQRSTLLARRTAAGWSLPGAIEVPGYGPGTTYFEPLNATPDLGVMALRASSVKPLSQGTSERDFWLRDGAGASTALAAGLTDGLAELRLSPDGSSAFLITTEQLAGDTHTAGSKQLYQWTRTGGLRVVGLDGEGNPLSPCGAVLGFTEEPRSEFVGTNPISADGSRIFFTSPDPFSSSSCKEMPNLYLRESGSPPVEISAPPSGVPDWGAQFVGATPDGSQVFFTSGTRLTPDKATEGREHVDLFRYDVATGVLVRLSVGPPGSDDASIPTASGHSMSGSPQVLVAADGSRVYFVARGRLVPGKGTAGASNLYLWEEGAPLRFIATLASRDNLPEAFTTPDGSVLVFESEAKLTAYDNTVTSGGKTFIQDEIYRYDASSGSLTCVSCRPQGAPPQPLVGSRSVPVLLYRPNLGISELASESVGGDGRVSTPVELRRAISTDGSTVFFTSAEELLPGIGNGLPKVYEWRDGVVSPISSPTVGLGHADYLLGMSADGSDVFILTNARLVPGDDDAALDVYDARVDGGFPEPLAPTPCEPLSGACQGSSATPVPQPPPATESVLDAGSAAPAAAGERACPPGKSSLGRRCLTARAIARRRCRRLSGNARRRCVRRQVRRLAAGSSTRRVRSPRDHRRSVR